MTQRAATAPARGATSDIDLQAAVNTAFDAATARMSEVLASDEYRGREALAHDLIANGKMTSSEIISALGKATGPEGVSEAAEEAARAEMRASIAETQNSNVDANGGGGGGGGTPGSANAEGVWDKAIASMSWDKTYDRVFGKRA